MIRTLAPQQGHMAAGARPCNGLGHGYQWNAIGVDDPELASSS